MRHYTWVVWLTLLPANRQMLTVAGMHPPLADRKRLTDGDH